jgi:hypothetical protein
VVALPGAQKAAATKKQRLAEYVETVKIEVPQLSNDNLIWQACDNYNSLPQRERDGNWASTHSNPEFLARICVNYLRHCLTHYESHLAKIAGKVGVGDAYVEIKTKVLEAIAERYVWLADECLDQELALE